MQRTVYDAELRPGMRKKQRDATVAAVRAAHPGAVVVLVEHKPPRGPRQYRIVAQLRRGARR